MKINNYFKGFILIMMADLLWGLSGTIAKYLFNNQFSPIDLGQIRITLSFIILAVYLLITNPKLLKIERKDLSYVIILGVFGLSAVQFFYYYTISETNVATAVFLEYLGPIFILLYGLISKKESVNGIKLLSVTGAAIGGLLIVKGTTGNGMSVTIIGLITGLSSAITFAFYTVYGKYGLSKYSAWTLLFWGMGSGSIVWSFIKLPWITFSNHSTGDWLFFIYIAVFCTIIPYGFFLKGLYYLPPLFTSITSNMEPVLAGIVSYLILGEVLTYIQVIGCTLVIFSVIILQFYAERSAPQLTVRSSKL